jgi:hypothetical protein
MSNQKHKESGEDSEDYGDINGQLSGRICFHKMNFNLVQN